MSRDTESVPRDQIRETDWGLVAEIDGTDVPLIGEMPEGDAPVTVERLL